MGHDPGASDDLGDDTIYASWNIQDISIRAEGPPGTPSLEWGADYENTTIEHPVFITLERAFDLGNEALPEPLRPYLKFRYGQVQPNSSDGFVISAYPYKLVPLGPENKSVSVPVFFYMPHYVERERIYPLAKGGATPLATDRVLDVVTLAATLCRVEEEMYSPQTCELRRALAPEVIAEAKRVLPNAVIYDGARAAALSIQPADAATPALHAALVAAERPSSSDAESGAAWSRPRDAPPEGASQNALAPSVWASPSATAPAALFAASLPAVALHATREALPWLLAAAALLLPLLALLHYIAGARALEHPQRLRMLMLAKAHPGILMGEAANRLGLSFHSAAHHARILKRGGHVEVVRAGRNLAIYPVGSVPLRHRQALVGLRRGPQAKALVVVRAHPQGRLPELAAAMGCTKSSAHAKLASLRAAGYLTWDRRSGYAITPEGQEALRILQLEPSQGGQPLLQPQHRGEEVAPRLDAPQDRVRLQHEG